MSEEEKAQLFLGELFDLCRKHCIWLSHEDGHGGFELVDESTEDWLSGANDRRQKINGLILLRALETIGHMNDWDLFTETHFRLPHLEKLEADGLVSSAEADNDKFGRTQKLYTITNAGHDYLSSNTRPTDSEGDAAT